MGNPVINAIATVLACFFVIYWLLWLLVKWWGMYPQKKRRR